MASENKKRKAKNSYLSNGGEKIDGRHKRLFYYTKRNRKSNNQIKEDQKGAGAMKRKSVKRKQKTEYVKQICVCNLVVE